MLLGGLTFKYFTLTNCGLMIRTLVKNVEKREEVTKALVDRAVDVLDQNAVSRGHLVGCNAIFLEIRETQVRHCFALLLIFIQPVVLLFTVARESYSLACVCSRRRRARVQSLIWTFRVSTSS